MKLTKLLFLSLPPIAVIPCVSLASCSNAMGVKNVSAKLNYNSKPYAESIDFTIEYADNVAEVRSGDNKATINGNFAKLRFTDSTYGSIIRCANKYQHLTIGVVAIMIDGTNYRSTIELDGYYNYAMSGTNYLTEIKNVKIVSW